MVAAARASRRSRCADRGCIGQRRGSALSATRRPQPQCPRRDRRRPCRRGRSRRAILYEPIDRARAPASRGRPGSTLRRLLEKRRRRSRASASSASASRSSVASSAQLLREPGAARVGGLLERSVKDALQPLPLFGVTSAPVASLPPPSSARLSHARASAHCRFTVAGEMPRASAVSSTVRPPK